MFSSLVVTLKKLWLASNVVLHGLGFDIIERNLSSKNRELTKQYLTFDLSNQQALGKIAHSICQNQDNRTLVTLQASSNHVPTTKYCQYIAQHFKGL